MGTVLKYAGIVAVLLVFSVLTWFFLGRQTDTMPLHNVINYLTNTNPDRGLHALPFESRPSKPAVWFHSFDKSTLVLPSHGERPVELPDTLVMQPAVYNVHGQGFHFDREGVYRIISPTQQLQRIVYREDLIKLLSSISWVVAHGISDERRSIEVLIEKAKTRKLYLACGRNVQFAQTILSQHGYAARQVSLFASNHLDGFSDGHVMLEVYDDRNTRWVLVDFDLNSLFLKPDGGFASFLDLIDHLEGLERISLSADVALDLSGFKAIAEGKPYDLSLFAESTYTTAEGIATFHKRVSDVPAIYEDGVFYVAAGDTKILDTYDLRYRMLNRKQLIAKFYPDLQRRPSL